MSIGPDIYCVRLVGGEFDRTEMCVTQELPPEIRMPRHLKEAKAGEPIPHFLSVATDFVLYRRDGRDPATTEFLYRVTS